MENLLRQTKALVLKNDCYVPGRPKAEAVVRLFATHLEIDQPFQDLKQYLVGSINNIFTRANGFSFVCDNLNYNIDITPLSASEDQKELKSWVPLIQFFKSRHDFLALHTHKLTECKEKIDGMKCNRCKFDTKYKLFSCEFCNGLTLCGTCNSYSLNIFNKRRQSKHHPHILSKFVLHRETYLQLSRSQPNKCGICSTLMDPKGSFYGCFECMAYLECEQCSIEQYRGDTATLDVDMLSGVLKYDESSREYVLTTTNETICPKEMNIVTPGYLDLTKLYDKPLDDAYFEVTFLAFDSQKRVGIILDVDHESQARLFGQDTIGYLNDGVLYNSSLLHPIATLTQIQPGDTVGMGVLLDSYNQARLYMTHNGVMQHATVLLSQVKKYAFGVCFTKQAEIRFKAQMRGSYLFDLNSVLDYRNDRKNYLEDVPREIPLLLLSWMAHVPTDLILLRQVCKAWFSYTNDNFIWKALFLKKWPLQNPNLPVTSWKRFYRSRSDSLKPTDNNFLHPIENCQKHDDCPGFWQKLPKGQNKHERHCDKCDKTVYSAHKKQFAIFKADGRRVCLTPQKSVGFNNAVVVIGMSWWRCVLSSN